MSASTSRRCSRSCAESRRFFERSLPEKRPTRRSFDTSAVPRWRCGMAAGSEGVRAMGTRANVRRRLAIGVAGALLVSALVGNLAPVAADDGNQGVPTTQDRDITAVDRAFLIGADETGMAGEGRLTITSVAPAAVVVDLPQAAPDPTLSIENGRDDRD